MNSRTQEVLHKLAARMSALLANDPEWEDQAIAVERVLEEANLSVNPSHKSPQAFANSLFQDNLAPLAESVLERGMNPESLGDSPLDLVTMLLPSDHHLD